MMLGANRVVFFMGVLMVMASVSAEYLKPTKLLVNSMPPINLEKMIPAQFGEWKIDFLMPAQVVDPSANTLLDKIYGQTLTRTYFNRQGVRIMLSIAYGGDQSKEMEVHRPEVCYTGQGFQVLKNRQGTLSTKFGLLPVKRLNTVRGIRNEPVTYWIVVGNEAAVGINVKLEQIRYGLTGTIPDGILVRVSSISSDPEAAYRDQDEFIRAMLSAMSKEDRFRLIGHLEI